jgi:primosomal protein N' (replication factor Y)
MKDKYYTTLAACLRCVTPAAKADGRFPASRAKAAKPILVPSSIQLTDEQTRALDTINAEQGRVVLLHGVTGSGKTEVYMQAIAQAIAQNRQAIMLVPEIALTPQMVSFFKKNFGDKLAVTHSRLTAKERRMQWERARKNEAVVMIGPRSAVFAPFSNLGIIVIDEEHEHTYRSDSTPKYAAAEIAIKRSELSEKSAPSSCRPQRSSSIWG